MSALHTDTQAWLPCVTTSADTSNVERHPHKVVRPQVNNVRNHAVNDQPAFLSTTLKP
jgi:hypothetical protein